MKPVLIGLLAATAYSADYATGIYKVKNTSGDVSLCCFPTGDIKVTQPKGDATQVNVEFTFDPLTTAASTCKNTNLQGKSVNGGKVPDANGDVKFTDTNINKDYILSDGANPGDPLTLNLQTASTDGNEACIATLEKKTVQWTYQGLYEVASQGGTKEKCCYPSGDIVIKQDSTSKQVTAGWTFDATASCVTSTASYKGKTVNLPATGPAANVGDVYFNDGTKDFTLEAPTTADGAFKLDLGSIGSTVTDCEATLKTKTLPQHTYAGVYVVDTPAGTTGKCCYPAGDIKIAQDDTSKKVTIDWTFGDSTTACKADVRGKPISGKDIAPDAVTGDVTFTDATDGIKKSWTLDYPSTTTGAFILDLANSGDGVTDCSATLKLKSTTAVTYTGVYEVEKEVGYESKKCCYPDGDVKVTQDKTSKEVTVAWKFENTADCYDTTVKGKSISGKATPDSDGDIIFVDNTDGVKKTWTLEAPSTKDGNFVLDLSSISSECAANLDEKSGYLLGLGSLVALSLSYIVF